MIRGFALSTRGNQKHINDDKVVLDEVAICAGMISTEIIEPTIAAVFDGVSQGGRGDEASNYAASLVIEKLSSFEKELGAANLKCLLDDINNYLVNLQKSEKAYYPIATTISGIAIDEDSRVIGFNSGDSRVYRFRSGMLVQMTTDHTIIQSLTDSGADDYLIDEAENSSAHIITKALGLQTVCDSVAEVDDFGEFVEGDIYLGCTDGLYDFIGREDIKRALSADVGLDIVGRTLVDMAIHKGSYDNISLFLLAKEKK